MPHIHEKIDFTSEVFVVFNHKVLLRKHDKYKLWLSIGGHIELDEDPCQAAIREVKEEVGLDIELVDSGETRQTEDDYKELIPPRFLYRHCINETHEHICFVYFARSTTDKTSNQSEELSEDIRWFSLEELDNPEITDHVRNYAKRALVLLTQQV